MPSGWRTALQTPVRRQPRCLRQDSVPGACTADPSAVRRRPGRLPLQHRSAACIGTRPPASLAGPPSLLPIAALLLLALRLLHALAGTAACAWGAASHGGTLFLLTLLLPTYQGELRAGPAPPFVLRMPPVLWSCTCRHCFQKEEAHRREAQGFLAGQIATQRGAHLLLYTCLAVPEEQRETFDAARVAAASLLARLCAHSLHGARITLLLRQAKSKLFVGTLRAHC